LISSGANLGVRVWSATCSIQAAFANHPVLSLLLYCICEGRNTGKPKEGLQPRPFLFGENAHAVGERRSCVEGCEGILYHPQWRPNL